MGTPPAEVLRHRLDDLLVEVEPEVVAGRVVGQPLVADADLAPVDLVDHGVDHVVRVLQPGEVLGGADPALQPAVVVTLTPSQGIARVPRGGMLSARAESVGRAGWGQRHLIEASDRLSVTNPSTEGFGGLLAAPRRWRRAWPARLIRSSTRRARRTRRRSPPRCSSCTRPPRHHARRPGTSAARRERGQVRFCGRATPAVVRQRVRAGHRPPPGAGGCGAGRSRPRAPPTPRALQRGPGRGLPYALLHESCRPLSPVSPRRSRQSQGRCSRNPSPRRRQVLARSGVPAAAPLELGRARPSRFARGLRTAATCIGRVRPPAVHACRGFAPGARSPPARCLSPPR